LEYLVSSTTVVNTPLAAITPLGLFNLWQGGFTGVFSPWDRAALITGPSNLLTVSPLSALLFTDLTLDPASIIDISGAWQVTESPSTGIAVASATLSLPVDLTLQYSGLVVYNDESATLYYVAAFPQFPPTLTDPLLWSIAISAGSCQQ
jgi:hypothetical protein